MPVRAGEIGVISVADMLGIPRRTNDGDAVKAAPGAGGGRRVQAALAEAAIAGAASRAAESDTQPKMPPCALIISSPTRWNSGM